MSFQKRAYFLSSYKTASTHVAVVYRYLLRNPGHTIADLEFHSVGFKMSSIRAAVSRLLDMGLIKTTGTFETNESTYSELTAVTDPKEWNKLAKQRNINKLRNNVISLLKNKDQLTKNCVRVLKKELKTIETT